MDELISFRTDKKVVKELAHVQEEEHIDRSTAVRKIFEAGLFEWKKEDVVKHILRGKMSLSKAAKILGVSYYQMLEILREKKAAFVSLTKKEVEHEAEEARRG